MVDFTIKKFGKLDILVLNAGISAHQNFKEIEDFGPFKRTMEVNFFGYVYPTRYALKYLEESLG